MNYFFRYSENHNNSSTMLNPHYSADKGNDAIMRGLSIDKDIFCDVLIFGRELGYIGYILSL